MKLSTESLIQIAKSARSRFEGVYSDYDAAVAAIPASSLVGYDHDELATLYLPAIGQVRPSDYPVLFWMHRILPSTSSVFDWGGNIGISYFNFASYLNYPAGLAWTICDLPTSCKAGMIVAEQRQAPLRFTSDFHEAEGIGLLLCLGALQYIPESLYDRLASLKDKPQHILINRIPLWDGEDFVTLEQIARARCAYKVFSRQRFIASILKLGYELADQWETADLSCYVRWQPRHSIHRQSGLYFRRIESSSIAGCQQEDMILK